MQVYYNLIKKRIANNKTNTTVYFLYNICLSNKSSKFVGLDI